MRFDASVISFCSPVQNISGNKFKTTLRTEQEAHRRWLQVCARWDWSDGTQVVGNQAVAISISKASPQEMLTHEFQTCVILTLCLPRSPGLSLLIRSDGSVDLTHPCWLWALNQGLSSLGSMEEAPLDLIKTRDKQTLSLCKNRNPWLCHWVIFPVGSEGLDLLLSSTLFYPSSGFGSSSYCWEARGKKGTFSAQI